MAEYTIPKPYRDFYVTDPLIELKNNLQTATADIEGLQSRILYLESKCERMQIRITDLENNLLSGYTASESFEGSTSQVITFTSEKDGFSITNDSDTETLIVSENITGIPTTADGWTQGNIPSISYYTDANVVHLTTNISVKPNTKYMIQSSFIGEFRIAIYEFDIEGNLVNNYGFSTSSNITLTTKNTTSQLNFIIARFETGTLNPDELISSLKYLKIIGETRSVLSGETRVIISPISSLHIESNVPHHGHALDLSE